MNKLGVLVSGRGSNLKAVLEAIEEGRIEAQVALVVSDQPEAPALEMAAAKGVAVATVRPRDFSSKASYETHLAKMFQERGVSLVVLAGFMRLLGRTFLAEFPEAVINIHPSLLPAFPGLHAQKQAFDYGVKIAGCTVHYVNEIMDGGRIIAQAAVEVLPDDTEETLAARILKEEHRLLPEVIRQLTLAKLS